MLRAAAVLPAVVASRYCGAPKGDGSRTHPRSRYRVLGRERLVALPITSLDGAESNRLRMTLL